MINSKDLPQHLRSPKDPYPDAHGVLLSDYIREYSRLCHLIEPFDEQSLQPASYELHVGERFYIDNKPVEPDKHGRVYIPKNGLLYFGVAEKINLPPYIIACHDLRVKQVYRGLLVGRSVHIAPGYSGHINYPIFNFTSQDRSLTVGEAIGTVIFIKTTPFGSTHYWEDQVDPSRVERVPGVDGKELKVAPPNRDRPIPEYWLGGETHTSAVLELQDEFERLAKRVTIGWFSVAGVVAAVLLGIFVHIRWVYDKVDAASQRISANERETLADRSKLDRGMDAITARLNLLETRLNQVRPPAPSRGERPIP